MVSPAPSISFTNSSQLKNVDRLIIELLCDQADIHIIDTFNFDAHKGKLKQDIPTYTPFLLKVEGIDKSNNTLYHGEVDYPNGIGPNELMKITADLVTPLLDISTVSLYINEDKEAVLSWSKSEHKVTLFKKVNEKITALETVSSSKTTYITKKLSSIDEEKHTFILKTKNDYGNSIDSLKISTDDIPQITLNKPTIMSSLQANQKKILLRIKNDTTSVHYQYRIGNESNSPWFKSPYIAIFSNKEISSIKVRIRDPYNQYKRSSWSSEQVVERKK